MKILGLIFEMCYLRLCSLLLLIRYQISLKNYLMVISEDDMEVNYYALAHLDEYAKKKYAKKMTVVTAKEWVHKNAKKLSNVCGKVIKVSEKQLNTIIKCNKVEGKIVIISFDKTPDKMLKNLIGVSDITKEDLVCYCFYELFGYKDLISYEDYMA